MADSLPNAEQIDVLLQVTRIFEDLGIQYFVGGSLASNAYGFYRATADADVIAAIKPEQIQPLMTSLQPSFYVDAESLRTAVASRSSFNIIHLETVFKVDVFVAKFGAFHAAQFRRRQRKQIGTTEKDSAWVASPEDTILAKLDWFRMGGMVSDRQWGDITGVMKIQKHTLDLPYLRELAADMHLTDLLDKAFRDSGLID